MIDIDAKTTLVAIQNIMDKMDCTTDCVGIFVHHFGRICAKVTDRQKGIFAGWGDTVEEAMANLLKELGG